MDSILISHVKSIVEQQFEKHSADHDFAHIIRVYDLAMHIQKKEGGDPTIIACAALLHDISDHKLNGGILNDGGRVAASILSDLKAEESIIQHVSEIIDAVSFKGAAVKDEKGSFELDIVRDADRLDAIGAIGIARAFHFGGSRNRPFFRADLPPKEHQSFEDYTTSKSHTINHFYEKLLLIQDRLITPTAKEIGKKRHSLMETFLEHFHQEWNVELDS